LKRIDGCPWRVNPRTFNHWAVSRRHWRLSTLQPSFLQERKLNNE
jgi:hypothetical protein